MTRWTQNGIRWECDAYDHGPMCRQCRPVDRVFIVDCPTCGARPYEACLKLERNKIDNKRHPTRGAHRARRAWLAKNDAIEERQRTHAESS